MSDQVKPDHLTDAEWLERVRVQESIIRYAYRLPARTQLERDAFAEFAQLDSDAPPFAIRMQTPPAGISDEDIRARAERQVAEQARRVADQPPGPQPTGDPPF